MVAAAILLVGCAAQGKSSVATPSEQSKNVAADTQVRPTTGIDDIAKTGLEVTFAEPTTPAKVSEDDAKAVAVQRFGAPPPDSPVAVEYKLLSDSKNESRPVYAVTYHNLPPTPSNGPVSASNGPPGGLPSNTPQGSRRLTVFVDANSGEYLYALSR